MEALKRWRLLMRPDALLLLVALATGVAGSVLAAQYLGKKSAAVEAGLRSRYEPSAVVVAAQDLAVGELLDATRLAVRRMPKEFLPADAVPAERAAELIGGHTAIPISRGAPVVAAALRRGQPPARLSKLLHDGRRALTIAVDQVNSQAGNLLPGDWVDLYYSRSSDGDALLVPLLQHVEVLATGASLVDGTQASEPDRSYSTITLGMSADDAARVVLAQQAGSVAVLMRAPDDTSQAPLAVRSSAELLRNPARTGSVAGDSRVELLVGGSGSLVPERSWISVGKVQVSAAGDRS
jgi:pilus assembly protein CpaB